MKHYKDKLIIGVDHGYGNIKTANTVMASGVMEYDSRPDVGSDILLYDGKYYIVGEGHKEFTAEKTGDKDYYILTLAAIARELRREDLTEGEVVIAAGLPLTWVNGQKHGFADYLTSNRTVDFTYRDVDYHIGIAGAEIFPQGFSAVFENIAEFKGANMLCDIGNGTMNVMMINNRRPVADRLFTEKYGTQQCAIAVRNAVMTRHHAEIDEGTVNDILRTGTADIDPDCLATVIETAKRYTAGIFRKLREHGYDARVMRLYILGGGGCLVRNFGEYDKNRVTVNGDIRATAKGYEYCCLRRLERNDRHG